MLDEAEPDDRRVPDGVWDSRVEAAVRAWPVRRAEPADAAEVAQLLHDFNEEFATPSPGAAVLAPRLASMFGAGQAIAYLTGDPGVAVALVTRRPNVWYERPVWLLDELYVVPERRGHGAGSALITRMLEDAAAEAVQLIEIGVDESDVDARRFYLRHGFSWRDPATGDRAFWLWRELE